MTATVNEALEQAEYRILCRAVSDACLLNARGDAWAGYRCLSEGLERARSLAQEGNEWANELTRSYLVALEEYAGIAAVSCDAFEMRTSEPPSAVKQPRNAARV
jgi:hypothetical protein